MKNAALLLPFLLAATVARADACWFETDDDQGKSVMRSAQCYENVSVPEFDKTFCRGQPGDARSFAATCPATAMIRESGQRVEGARIARCTGMKQPLVTGSVTTVYYTAGGTDLQRLRNVCEGLDGRWEAR